MTSPSPGGGHPLAELSHHAVPRPLLDGQAIKPQLTAKLLSWRYSGFPLDASRALLNHPWRQR